MPDVPQGHLYLGERLDPKTRKRTGEPVMLDSADLTTHGVIVGMTGSGKTGLGVVLLEEALLQGIPTLVFDPKGDLGNLLLTFPDLEPADFAPWVEDGDPAGVAKQWKQGLADWGIEPKRISSLRAAAEFTIYTPGSSSGVSLNIVGSLQQPVEGSDSETVDDEVEGFVTGLLNLVGIASDPVSGKEHILLSNLIHKAWDEGHDLDLMTLVGQVQRPPITQLGAYQLEDFYPEKERTKLATTLNGLLASRAFAAWAEGPALDIGRLLQSDDGSKPACAIVSLSHLSDDERQFVVSLVLGKLVTWMRRQQGTGRLRTLVYFDEVMGYVPPNGAPPAKKPLLTLFKQARAFGVGLVLATQNPVDVDYKGLSNAGTWMIGRLQTEQDKARLLDGLKSLQSGEVDIKATGETISSLDKREFMLRGTSGPPELFTSRWAMSYLRGPLTREQIASLMEERKRQLGTSEPAPSAEAVAEPAPPPQPEAEAPPEPQAVPGEAATPESQGTADEAAAPEPVAAATAAASGSAGDDVTVAPQVADGIPVRWLDPAAGWAAQIGASPSGTRLAPGIVAQASVLYDDSKLGVRQSDQWCGVVFPLDATVDPNGMTQIDAGDSDLRDQPPADASYQVTAALLGKKSYFTAAEKSIVDHVFATAAHQVLRNRQLKLVAEPGEDAAAFEARCRQAALEASQADRDKLDKKYATRLDRAEDAVSKAHDRVAVAEATHNTRRTTAMARGAGSILGNILSGRKSRSGTGLSQVLTGGARTAESGQRVESAANEAQRRQEALADLQAEHAQAVSELDAAWQAKAAEIDTDEVRPKKSNIRVTALTLVWIPVT